MEKKKINEYVTLSIKILLISTSVLLPFFLIAVEKDKIPYSAIVAFLFINYNNPMVRFQFQIRSSNLSINSNLAAIKLAAFVLFSENLFSIVLVLIVHMYMLISLFSFNSVIFFILCFILFFNIFISEKHKYINYLFIIIIYVLNFIVPEIVIKLPIIILGIIVIIVNILNFSSYTKEKISERKKINLTNRLLFPIKYFFILSIKDQLSEVIMLVFLFSVSVFIKWFPIYESLVLILIFEDDLYMDKIYEKKDSNIPRFFYIYRSDIRFLDRFILSDFYVNFFKYMFLFLLVRIVNFINLYKFIMEICLIVFISLIYYHKYEKMFIEDKKQNTFIFQYLIFAFIVAIRAI